MSTSMRSAEKGTAAGSSSKRPCAGKDGDDEEATKHFRLDSDASSLHCPICLTQYEGQIYMCANGHAACARCCLGMNRKCGCCNEPIGDVRCRALENLLADLTAPCAFRDFGCGELLRYTELRAHEETCTTTSSPSTTPPASSSSPPRTWGPRRCRSHARRVVFVLLNGGEVLGGRCLSLVRLGPSSRNEGDDAAEVRIIVAKQKKWRWRRVAPPWSSPVLRSWQPHWSFAPCKEGGPGTRLRLLWEIQNLTLGDGSGQCHSSLLLHFLQQQRRQTTMRRLLLGSIS
ncbi:hypothetical protein QOZ80_1BG0055840 [Eleusine coracana subsp. coracana]|nr:hypothetical protein QOZ80_1BG0055840 [Eleusine coracana subsp. coracana]